MKIIASVVFTERNQETGEGRVSILLSLPGSKLLGEIVLQDFDLTVDQRKDLALHICRLIDGDIDYPPERFT